MWVDARTYQSKNMASYCKQYDDDPSYSKHWLLINSYTRLEAQNAPRRPRVESSSQTSRVTPTVHTLMVERVLAREVVTMKSSVVVKASSASPEVVERVRSL